MHGWMSKRLIAIGTGLAIVIAAIAYRVMIPLDAERIAAIPTAKNVDVPSSSARSLYASLAVADLHADSLVWTRDLSERSEQGQVDIPRLIENGVRLQVFMAAIDAPNDISGDSIAAEGDQITQIVLADGWPLRTIWSHFERARFLSNKLHHFENAAVGRFTIVKSQADLRSYLESARKYPAQTAGILGIEGPIALEEDLDKIERLVELGYRSMSLAHYNDTAFSGSSSGRRKGGLTDAGREAVKRMEQAGIIVDLAHMSDASISDVLDMAKRPVFASHVGVRAVCPVARNLDDTMIVAIAETGGLIGVGFSADTTCTLSIDPVVDSIVHIRNLVGAQHVALGSGFDIAALPLGLSDLPILIDHLRARGLDDEEIAGVMGANAIAFYGRALPE